MNVVIKRCPLCSAIRDHAQVLVEALADDLGIGARIEDGEPGELAVYADGVPVLQRTGDTLPSVEEVDAAVNNAFPLGV